MSAVNLKYKDESWDFRESDTKEYTDCFHTYPAMMIPRLHEDCSIDLEHSITSIAHVLSPRATICYVVGNRRVKEVILPTDEFIATIFRQHGFAHKETIVRNIPNKRMPKKNSPSNIAGKTSTTMQEEYIVVCQRKAHTW